MKKLKKAALFTDIHFGRHQNSEQHNQDCLNYLGWFCEQVRQDPSIDHIWFLGDWHEHRAAINAFTLQRSYNGAKLLNELGMPVYFLVGNHDLAFRNTRNTFTTEIFEPFSNFRLLSDVEVLDEIHGGVLAIPYLREDEYPTLLQHKDIPVAMGHLELKGFRVSGASNVMEHGPEAKDFFKHQKKVFTGHFHQRQTKGNVHYIGNTFPADFSDVNDTERGMAVYDFTTDDLVYIDWPDAPQYRKSKLTEVLKNPKKLLANNARVRIEVDTELSLEEANELRSTLQEKYKLREITLEDTLRLDDIVDLTEEEQEIEDLKLESTTEVIRELIRRIKVDKIDTDLLLSIYDGLSSTSNGISTKASSIEFLELTLQNFLSYGNAVTKVNLDFTDPTLIIGRNYDSVVDGQIDSNGAGKSSILNGLLLCLYDDNLMGVKKDAQINNSNGKNMMLTCVFKVNTTYYKVERYRKNKPAGGDGVRIYINEQEPVFDESHDKTPDSVDNANKFIAEKLGIPYEMFIRIVVFSATHKPFLSLPSSHASQANQKDIIEELFGLTEITSKAEILKEILKGDKRDFATLESTNEIIMGEITRLMEQIHNNDVRLAKWNDDHATKLAGIKEEIEGLESIDLYDSIEGFKAIEALNNESVVLDKNLPVLRAELKNIQGLAGKYEQWEKDHVSTMESLQEKIKNFQAYDFAKLKEQRDELNNLRGEEQVLSNNISGMKRELAEFQRQAKDHESKIGKLREEIAHLEAEECPYCRQQFSESKDKVHTCKDDLQKKSTAHVEALTEIENQTALIEEAEELIADIRKSIKLLEDENIPSNLDSLEQSLEIYVERLERESSATNPYVGSDDDLTEQELIDSIEELTEQLEKISQKKTMAGEFINPAFKSMADIQLHNAKITNLKTRLAEVEQEVNPFISVGESLLNQKTNEPKTDELNILNKKIKHQDFLVKLLTKKDSFIRKALLNKSIPLLNTRLRMYLDKIGLPHKVKFNEEMGVDISQFGSNYEYGQFSSGQKARVNICLAFAFRDVLQSRFGKINLCILDECLDTGLGSVGVGLVSKMIKSIAVENDLSMFVISHRDEVSTMFDTRLEIELKNGFSTIVQEAEDA